MTELKAMTRTQRVNFYYLTDAMRRLEWDLHNHIEATSRIPDEWHRIAQERTPRRKIKVTLALEEDVVKFFKSMGTGHGPRMNEVLRTYMHARLVGIIKGPEAADFHKRCEEEHDGPRPMWGDTARLMGEGAPVTAKEVADEKRALLRGEVKRRRVQDV